jgi:hypothetical protein
VRSEGKQFIRNFSKLIFRYGTCILSPFLLHTVPLNLDFPHLSPFKKLEKRKKNDAEAQSE